MSHAISSRPHEAVSNESPHKHLVRVADRHRRVGFVVLLKPAAYWGHAGDTTDSMGLVECSLARCAPHCAFNITLSGSPHAQRARGAPKWVSQWHLRMIRKI
jgi:hypothetical protein